MLRLEHFLAAIISHGASECVYVYEIYSCGQMKVEIQGRAVQRGKLEPPFYHESVSL